MAAHSPSRLRVSPLTYCVEVWRAKCQLRLMVVSQIPYTKVYNVKGDTFPPSFLSGSTALGGPWPSEEAFSRSAFFLPVVLQFLVLKTRSSFPSHQSI
ncbi:hypothetical protein TNCV_966951 [Trichonephila clavipes]|nr:hypothetical protein TNCV_966951 [Trichonephila clavipes]